MKLINILLSIILTTILIIACNSPTENNEDELRRTPSISEGVWGFVRFWEGDFMPPASGDISSVERTVLIYEQTSFEEVVQVGYSAFYERINTHMIDSVFSNSEGFFQCSLPTGEYSLFVREESLFYSNLFDGYGNIFPISVTQDSLVKVNFDITYKATF